MSKMPLVCIASEYFPQSVPEMCLVAWEKERKHNTLVYLCLSKYYFMFKKNNHLS